MNRHPALIVTGLLTHEPGYHVLDVPPDLERLIPSGIPGLVVDRPYVNTGVLASMAPGGEIVEVWAPGPDEFVPWDDAANSNPIADVRDTVASLRSYRHRRPL